MNDQAAQSGGRTWCEAVIQVSRIRAGTEGPRVRALTCSEYQDETKDLCTNGPPSRVLPRV